MSAIEVQDLTKTYTVKVSDPTRSGVSNFLSPKYKTVEAVKGITFSVAKGETVALIGPNGAGKSTTLKMLTGILHPTGGSARVLGLSPQHDRVALVSRIGAVFGQRSQLSYNLPLTDTFALYTKVYAIPAAKAKNTIDRLINTFALQEFLDQPVRKLSLGQRMRAEVAASLIHEPEIIFLDEPSIGLDVLAKRALRENLVAVNKEFGTTIVLTSHDAGDIESVCERTIVVNYGAIVFDGTTAELKRQYLQKKRIRVVYMGTVPAAPRIDGVSCVSHGDGIAVFELDQSVTQVKDALGRILGHYDVVDIAIEDPPLEEVIGALYTAHEHTSI